ncbi:hypothetical protein TPHA_0A02930 [Tetrapisispora phaffii CBS 4417]|uniref:Uncharacterized protein n=1 Tax=Tetrapisispora phaffii (strain ATCC 24235 / CBS 4417 / NBRC 1672 / NRRL Y-8282 / UCD 70-5) TaxID=1071381 RepID=G8BN95_TETPH|nr:hypothetical protein TPHA_0A02930 [Tetrapisispora phaffii CBS 4417]CCE61373.1 hypothetical protein TPHA_0A02930 [Tetrapisispora phaffii CBS 4417]
MKNIRYNSLKRLFSQLNSGNILNKNKNRVKDDNEELKNTIKYLIQNANTNDSIKFPYKNNSNIKKEQIKHIETISNVLNRSLPEVDVKKKNVEQHYQVLFSQLKNIVEKSISNTNSNTISNEDKTSTLYNELMLLKYNNRTPANRVNTLIKILLHKDFKEYPKVWNNITFFDNRLDRVNISLLLFYKTHNQQIYDAYFDDWLENYNSLSIPIKRIMWRCMSVPKDNHNVIKLLDILTMEKSQVIKPLDIMVIFQSLYKQNHALVDDSTIRTYCTEPLTTNQMLFIQVLKTLSKYSHQNDGDISLDLYIPKAKDWITSIVKLSVENKLCAEINDVSEIPMHNTKSLSNNSQGISFYKFKFIRALDINIQEIRLFCNPKRDEYKYAQLLNELDAITESLLQEEKEIKSLMSIKFI